MRRCHDCGFPLGKKDLYCPRCGAKQRREKAIPVIIGRAPQRAPITTPGTEAK